MWECGLRDSGAVVGVVTIVESPQPHSQFDWQAEFRQRDYDPQATRMLLRVFVVLDEPVGRSTFQQELEGYEPLFFRQPQGTTYLLEPEFVTLLADAANIRYVPDGEVENISSINLADQRRRRTYTAVCRTGQTRFHRNVAYADGHRCAISGTTVDNCLEAAHIVPHRGDQTDRTANGLLLRADLHRLFDAGVLRIHPVTRRVVLERVLLGTEYERFADMTVDRQSRLDQESLHWRWLNPTGSIPG
jgi:prepilin-type processing-associated H-X9-DG protein